MARVVLADSQPLFNEALEALFSRDEAHQVIGRCPSADDAFTVEPTRVEQSTNFDRLMMRVNEEIVSELDVPRARLDGALVQAGKRRYARLTAA